MKTIETMLGAAQMNAQMMESLKGVNTVMSQVNAQMNPQQMNKVMQEFAKETEKMGMAQEQMQDQFDMLADPDQESQADEVYNQILGEIGIGLNGDMATNSNQIAQPQAAAAQVSNSVWFDFFSDFLRQFYLTFSFIFVQPNAADNDLQARLDALKGLWEPFYKIVLEIALKYTNLVQ